VTGPSSPLLNETLSAGQLAALTALWGAGGDSAAEATAARATASGPAVTLANEGGGRGPGVGGDTPLGDVLGDGQFWDRAGGSGGLRPDLSDLQKQMDVDLLTPPKGGGGLPPHDPGNLMAQPFTAAAPPPSGGAPSGGVSIGGGVGQQPGSPSGTGIVLFAPVLPAVGPGQVGTPAAGRMSAGTSTPVSPLQPQGPGNSSVIIGPTGGVVSPAITAAPADTTSTTAPQRVGAGQVLPRRRPSPRC
jgi:hypothetical protein